MQTMTPSKKIVLLYADTGGGHRSTAQAVQQALQQLYGNAYDLHLVNGTAFMPYPFNQAEIAYPFFVNRARMTYQAFWRVTNNYWHTATARHYIEWKGREKARLFLQQHPAQVYVSCHPIVNQVVPGIIKKFAPNAAVLSVVSDLVTVHAGFWTPKIDHYCVPTAQARQRAIQNHIAPRKITVTGQPVLPDFAARVRQRRAQPGPDATSRSTVLVMGGGDGMGRLIETTLALANSALPIRVVVVCGRNAQARQLLLNAHTRVPMEVLGFCENVPELMGDADVLVTKAGPGSICEGFVAGLPILMYDAVPGQETGNIDYVVSRGAGAWCPSPQKVLDQLTQWLRSPDILQQLHRASAALAQPDSALRIAEIISRFATPLASAISADSSQFNSEFARPKQMLANVEV